LCVVTGHAGAQIPFIHDGTQAVQIFFMISGFYMALILDGKYTSLRQFYASRSLRIFVPYYMAVLFVILVSLVSGVLFSHYLALHPFFDATRNNGLAGVVLATLSNVTLLFQDVILYLSQPAGQALRTTANFVADPFPLWHYQLVPQCWSVSLELMFYLLVPFLARISSARLVAVAGSSLLLRVFAYEVLELKADPWAYRFFPFEIALFVLGMLGYRFYRRFLKQRPRKEAHPRLARLYSLGAATAFTAAHAYVVLHLTLLVGRPYGLLLSYALWPFGLGLLFHLGRSDRFDQKVGELSYPVYLLHFVLNMFLWVIFHRLGWPAAEWTTGFALVCAAVATGVAGLMYHFLLRPFEAWRGRLVSRGAAA
jgi:peptidoglycan/LPS O-acetylase OafA/YrhL